MNPLKIKPPSQQNAHQNNHSNISKTRYNRNLSLELLRSRDGENTQATTQKTPQYNNRRMQTHKSEQPGPSASSPNRPPPAAFAKQSTPRTGLSRHVHPLWVLSAISLGLALFGAVYAWQLEQKISAGLAEHAQFAGQQNLPAGPDLSTIKQQLDVLEQRFAEFKNTYKTSLTTRDDHSTSREARIKLVETQMATMSGQLDALQAAAAAEVIEAERKAVAQDQSASTAKKWRINFGSFRDRNSADTLRQRIAQLHESVEVHRAESGGTYIYRVRSQLFASQSDAEKVAENLRGELGLPALWINSDSS